MNSYIIYRHINAITEEVFYIGLGKDERRAYSKSGRNIFWKRIVEKYGYKVEIIYENLSRDEAIQIEVNLIKAIGRRDLKKGPLCNVTDGGDGTLNVSEESRDKMRKAKLGRKLTEEQRKKIVSRLIGRKASDETRKKISDSVLNGKHPSARKVIDIDTGIIYETIKEAANAISVDKSALARWLNCKYQNKSSMRILIYENGEQTIDAKIKIIEKRQRNDKCCICKTPFIKTRMCNGCRAKYMRERRRKAKHNQK